MQFRHGELNVNVPVCQGQGRTTAMYRHMTKFFGFVKAQQRLCRLMALTYTRRWGWRGEWASSSGGWITSTYRSTPPNGRRNTHAMAHEFQQSHPCGIVEAGCARPSVSSLSIPRLRKANTARSTEAGNSGLVLLHYTGKKHVNPPAVPLVTSGPSYEDVECTTLSLSRAQETDTQWLNSLFLSSALNPPMEWGGFNSQLAQQSTGCTKRGPSMHLFGPLINAPPAHPDTVLTSDVYDAIADRPRHDIHPLVPRYAVVHPSNAD